AIGRAGDRDARDRRAGLAIEAVDVAAADQDHLGEAVVVEVRHAAAAVADRRLPPDRAREVAALHRPRGLVGRVAADQLGPEVAVEIGDAGDRPLRLDPDAGVALPQQRALIVVDGRTD